MSFPPPPEDNNPNSGNAGVSSNDSPSNDNRGFVPPSPSGSASGAPGLSSSPDFPPAPVSPGVNNSYPGAAKSNSFASPNSSSPQSPFANSTMNSPSPYGQPPSSQNQASQSLSGQGQLGQNASNQPGQPFYQPQTGQPYYGNQPGYAPYYGDQSKSKAGTLLKNLFDLKFEHFISLEVAGLAYILGVVFDVLFALGLWITLIRSALVFNTYGNAGSAVALAVLSIVPIVIGLFLAVLLWRVTLESVVALIRVAENTTTLVKNTSKPDEVSKGNTRK